MYLISIFAFYRDIVEGGKPQFLFYYKVDLTFEEIEKNFNKLLRKDRKKKKTFTTDGKKLIPIGVDELKDIKLTAGSLTMTNGKKYKMMPSAVASVEMLKTYLGVNVNN